MSKAVSFVTVIAVLIIFIGLYSSAKTAVNFLFFKKYPTTGVLTFNFTGSSPYGQREEDCYYPQSYTTQDGKQRAPTEEEKTNDKKQKEICLSGILSSRQESKINDVSLSILLLVLGWGLLFSRKYFFKNSD